MKHPCRPPQWALNGRTVIDADLYDLNRTEILRGPQGTLYGAGSMGGTIKLVTNPPKLHALEGAAYVDTSQTTGGSTNGRGSLMLNVPIGDIASLRFVTTGKYISGWIHRYVIAPGQFPFPTNFGNCGAAIVYYVPAVTFRAHRSPRTSRTPTSSVSFRRGHPCWFNRPMLCPSPAASCISASMPTDTTITRRRPTRKRSISPTTSRNRTTTPSICGA